MLSLTADAFLFGSEKVVSISHVPSFPAIRTTAFSERQRVAGTRSPARGPRSKCGGHWAQRWTDSLLFSFASKWGCRRRERRVSCSDLKNYAWTWIWIKMLRKKPCRITTGFRRTSRWRFVRASSFAMDAAIFELNSPRCLCPMWVSSFFCTEYACAWHLWGMLWECLALITGGSASLASLRSVRSLSTECGADCRQGNIGGQLCFSHTFASLGEVQVDLPVTFPPLPLTSVPPGFVGDLIVLRKKVGLEIKVNS